MVFSLGFRFFITLVLRRAGPLASEMQTERRPGVASSTLVRCSSFHWLMLNVSALPKRNHACLKYSGIGKQPKDRDQLGVLPLCHHLRRHEVNLVASLVRGQGG
jgi:hypothetical protein